MESKVLGSRTAAESIKERCARAPIRLEALTRCRALICFVTSVFEGLNKARREGLVNGVKIGERCES